jgi:hypothetical protein
MPPYRGAQSPAAAQTTSEDATSAKRFALETGNVSGRARESAATTTSKRSIQRKTIRKNFHQGL